MESARESGHMPPDQMGHAAQSTKEPAQENKESAAGFLQQVQTVGPTLDGGPSWIYGSYICLVDWMLLAVHQWRKF